MRGIGVLLALGACAATSGCVTAAMGAAASVGVALAQERTLGSALDDATGAAEIKGRLLAADRNGYGEVDVEMAEGRLLLSGPVPTEAHRVEAERIAWSVSRVEAVANELRVGPRSGIMRSARDELITAQVRARLVASSEVRAIDVNVETHNGVVYLMGLARTVAEIEQAAEIASVTPGVQRVVSYMHVRRPAGDFAAARPFDGPSAPEPVEAMPSPEWDAARESGAFAPPAPLSTPTPLASVGAPLGDGPPSAPY